MGYGSDFSTELSDGAEAGQISRFVIWPHELFSSQYLLSRMELT
jgi:hypothetical protein